MAQTGADNGPLNTMMEEQMAHLGGNEGRNGQDGPLENGEAPGSNDGNGDPDQRLPNDRALGANGSPPAGRRRADLNAGGQDNDRVHMVPAEEMLVGQKVLELPDGSLTYAVTVLSRTAPWPAIYQAILAQGVAITPEVIGRAQALNVKLSSEGTSEWPNWRLFESLGMKQKALDYILRGVPVGKDREDGAGPSANARDRLERNLEVGNPLARLGRAKVKEPEVFKGGEVGKTEVEDWLAAMETYLDLTGAHQDTWGSVAKQYLGGRAAKLVRAAWKMEQQGENEQISWSWLSDFLLDLYTSHAQNAMTLVELLGCKYPVKGEFDSAQWEAWLKGRFHEAEAKVGGLNLDKFVAAVALNSLGDKTVIREVALDANLKPHETLASVVETVHKCGRLKELLQAPVSGSGRKDRMEGARQRMGQGGWRGGSGKGTDSQDRGGRTQSAPGRSPSGTSGSFRPHSSQQAGKPNNNGNGKRPRGNGGTDGERGPKTPGKPFDPEQPCRSCGKKGHWSRDCPQKTGKGQGDV